MVGTEHEKVTLSEHVVLCHENPLYRIENNYFIITKESEKKLFKLNAQQRDIFDNKHNRNLVLKARQIGSCLDPNTLVLKADMTWERIGNMKPGDEIVSVDEHAHGIRGKGRRLRRGVVQGVKWDRKECYRITFDNGKQLICTARHPWLSRKTNTGYDWRSVEDTGNNGNKKLKVGTKIRRICDGTWEAGDYEDGWIGGMLDGEGFLAKKNRVGGCLAISQVEGPVFDRLKRYFKTKGYNYTIQVDNKPERKSKFGKTAVKKVVLSRIDEIFRLLGTTRPSRFLCRDWWEGKELPRIGGEACATITKIENIGENDIVDLQTSTGTYIAEGFVSHNTTFWCLYMLDKALWNANQTIGIISHSMESAQGIFRRIRYAVDNMHPELKAAVKVKQDSARQLVFGNNSLIRVDTTMRGETLSGLLVSEFGKICARWPQKANEVMTGSLQTLSAKAEVVLESTAEGSDGYFWELCQRAMARGNEDLSPLEFKLHFYPWWSESTYSMESI